MLAKHFQTFYSMISSASILTFKNVCWILDFILLQGV